jgi:hypothetical protein
MSHGIHHQPAGADSEEVATDALRDALQQCFEPVADQAVPANMLAILARAVANLPAGEDA